MFKRGVKKKEKKSTFKAFVLKRRVVYINHGLKKETTSTRDVKERGKQKEKKNEIYTNKSIKMKV